MCFLTLLWLPTPRLHVVGTSVVCPDRFCSAWFTPPCWRPALFIPSPDAGPAGTLVEVLGAEAARKTAEVERCPDFLSLIHLSILCTADGSKDTGQCMAPSVGDFGVRELHPVGDSLTVIDGAANHCEVSRRASEKALAGLVNARISALQRPVCCRQCSF